MRFLPRPGRAAPLVLTLALTFVGCSKSNVPVIDVTGLVTFNGLPARAEVIFQPQSEGSQKGGRASSAWTAADGTFRLAYTEHRRGAVEGRHQVMIRVMRSDRDDGNRSFDDVTKPLKTVRFDRTVSPSSHRFTFALGW